MMFLLIVTVTSMLLAAIMSVTAWRIAGDERRRSDARVAALSAEIHDGDEVGRVLWQPPHSRGQQDPADNQLDPACSALFATPPSRAASRPFAIAGAGALVFGAAAAIAIVSGRGLGHAPGDAGTAVTAAAPTALPLELVALGHERAGDQLTVRGVVRNPASGASMAGLTAVVLVFTPDGGFAASGRAPLDAAALGPGTESTFVVTLPGAGDAARYRVSFRTGDRLVAHLDRRHES